MATRLQLYNEALTQHLGERRLASLTEAREPRRALDDVWDSGAVDKCLEQAQWKFAKRSSLLAYSSSVTPSFGYQYAFEKPTDFVRLTALCTDERYQSTLMRYQEEGGFWFADVDTIYIQYVSNDTVYGNDLSLWPAGFTAYVAAFLAYSTAMRITQSKQTKDGVGEDMKQLLAHSRSMDAMEGAAKIEPSGSWNAARNQGTFTDRSSKTSLYG